jgi:predicted DNA-binding transcriptional regulator AlpA
MSDQFIGRSEVQAVHPVKDKTRKRAEAAGLFPPRIKLAPRITVWIRSEVEAWQADPAAWQAKSVA